MSITTLRRWEASGGLAAEYTVSDHRRYDLAKLKPELFRIKAHAQRRTLCPRPQPLLAILSTKAVPAILKATANPKPAHLPICPTRNPAAPKEYLHESECQR